MSEDTIAVYADLFEHLKRVIFSEDFKERHREEARYFTRQRWLGFSMVVIFLLNLVKRSMQDELDEFYKLLSGADVAKRIVTKSAFTQARSKLKYTAFVELNRKQVEYVYNHLEYLNHWHGWRLVATDGSMSELPEVEEICSHFGVWHPNAGGICPKARVSQMFDVLNSVTLDAIIAPKEFGERALAAQHFAQLLPNDLVLLDRGYPAFWLFALIRQQRAHFCARMKLGSWKVVRNFVSSGLNEQIVTLTANKTVQKECQERKLSCDPLTVRLIRVELDSGEIEVLVTSLVDAQAHPVSVFKELYHDRWPVEEDYKVMKSRIEIENWSGMTVKAIYQDFHAKVFTKNLTAILALPAQKLVDQQSLTKVHDYHINMTNAFSKMKDTVVLLFQRPIISEILEDLWLIFIQTIEPVRPGRSYPRKARVKPRRFSVSYKPTR